MWKKQGDEQVSWVMLTKSGFVTLEKARTIQAVAFSLAALLLSSWEMSLLRREQEFLRSSPESSSWPRTARAKWPICGSSGSRVGEWRGSRRIRSSTRRLATSASPVGAIASSPRCRRPAGKARAALRSRSWSSRWRVTHLAGRPLASAALPRWDALALPHPFPVQGAGATSCR